MGQPPPPPRLVRLGRSRQDLGDLYHVLLRASWPALLCAIVVLFVAANALFATIYVLYDGVEGARPGSFADAFFFSIQTMATIGYGKMGPRTSLAHIVVAV